MAETIHDRIRTLIEKHNVKQNQLAKALKITPQAVNAWLRKGIQPSRENLHALSELFMVSVDEIEGRTRRASENSIIRIDTHSGNPIPIRVLGRISVSRMLRNSSNSTETTRKITLPFLVSPTADAFQMIDDSMNPTISAGDIIVIDPDKPYKADKLMAARIISLDVEVFRKFVYDGPDHCALVPLNPGHRSYKFTHEQWLKDVEVLGTFVAFIHRDE